jgi:type II secretory pathway pseudopilin PulG
MTLVEILVAITLVTVAILGLLGELASYIKQQHLEKTQVTAIRLANGSLESAQQMSFSALKGLAGTNTATQTVRGTAYTQTTKVQVCSATDSPNTCTTPTGSTPQVVHASVTVSWVANGSTHTIQLQRGYADKSTATVSSATSPLGNCGGSGTTLVIGSLSLSPSSVTVDSSGHPTSDIKVTLTQTGLSNATCVPLTWSDDTGPHQVSMTPSGSTFTVTIPKASITKTVSTSGATVPFTATVPGSQAVPSASLTIIGQPAFGTCSVQVLGLATNTITLVPLTRKSLLAVPMSCTTLNLSKTDTVKATYASGTGTQTVSMTSTDGTNWSVTLPANTLMASSGASEAITFSLTRASDGATATKSLTATLA